MQKLNKTALTTVGLLGICQFSKLFKVSYIIGSSCALFSMNNIYSPMVGVLSSSGVGALFFGLKALVKFFAIGGNPLLIVALQVPLICTAIAWNKKSFMAAVSVLSIILFNLNPVGSAAFVYSMLWLIPLAIAMLNKNNKFLTALGSTFTGHAVGSVAWLYFGPTLAPAIWVGLIPIALSERVVFALGMALSYQLYYYAVSLLNKYRVKQSLGASVL